MLSQDLKDKDCLLKKDHEEKNFGIFVYWMIFKKKGLMDRKKFLHIIAFNVPYPPDYGGIIDIYYKLKALNEVGFKIILHTFIYEREEAESLSDLCFKVYYYKRKNGLRYMFNPLPYIVVTRRGKALEQNLLNDDYPVIFEGLHTTFYLERCKKAGKKVLVRTHNIEHNYYRMLARSERSLFRKLFLFAEAGKLKRYEKVLVNADHLLAISTTDSAYFYELYGKTVHISAFHQHEKVTSPVGSGDYILFHGNLSVPENEQALLYLVRNVLSRVSVRVLIAGKDPGKQIQKKCRKHSNLELIINPDGDLMNQLVRDAHINLLYTFQPTGLKLKLLHSLYAGRHCMANSQMVSGSGLDELCYLYKSPLEAIQLIEELMKEPFKKAAMKERSERLKKFDNLYNAGKISELI